MYSCILHPTDLNENHFQLCQQVIQIARYFSASLHFLHVIESPPSLQLAQSLGFTEVAYPSKEDAETVMKILGDTLKIPPQHLHVEIGSIKMHVLEKMKTLKCDLIIIGSHTTNHLPAFLGSTAHAVVNNASCDVLTMRTF